jgi:hypothetical protein
VECLASALEQIIKPDRPTGGGAEVVAIDDMAYLIVSYCSLVFDDPPSKDFLQEITQSAYKSTLQ